jgi:hypothetical protein
MHRQSFRVVSLTASSFVVPVPATELAKIKATPEDEIVYCEDSGRILVRGEDAY